VYNQGTKDILKNILFSKIFNYLDLCGFFLKNCSFWKILDTSFMYLLVPKILDARVLPYCPPYATIFSSFSFIHLIFLTSWKTSVHYKHIQWSSFDKKYIFGKFSLNLILSVFSKTENDFQLSTRFILISILNYIFHNWILRRTIRKWKTLNFLNF